MEDPEEYYDVDDGYDEDDRADDQTNKKVAYPPRLMVDFTSLGMNALLRYAQFYQITVRDDCEKEELAAVVARHFDCTLEVEEDESIVSFMQRIRNGEKSVVRHRPPEKTKHADKKRKKSNSNSRKRQRGDPPTANGKDGKDAKESSSANGADAKSSAGSKGSDLHDDDQPLSQVARPQARSKPSGPPSGSSNAGSSGSSSGTNPGDKASSSSGGKSNGSRGKTADSKKKGENDNGEDNELYCICNLPSYGNMIACDGKKCPNPSQWYHLECVGFSDGRHPDTWLCPECDPKGFADFKSKKKKSKQRSKSPGSK